MFTQQEQQVVAATLQQRREWLAKQHASAETDPEQRLKYAQTLALLDSALHKLQNQDTASLEVAGAPPSRRSSSQSLRAQLTPDQIRVLIAEDDQDLAMLVSTYLSAAGINKVDIAADGIRAVNMLYDTPKPYHLMLCDWNMPLKNGLAVLEAIKASDRCRHTCFIMISGLTDARKIRSAIDEGVDDYVAKPIDQGILLKKIARFFPAITP